MTAPVPCSTIDMTGLGELIAELTARGYRVIGPTRSEGAIGYAEISEVGELPIGWTDRQDAGTYRLVRRDDEAVFGYVVGPQSWKKYLHPPRLRLWHAERDGDGFRIVPEPEPAPKLAFLGVRSCELHAIEIHDQVFLGQAHCDHDYAARREQVFVVAVNCVETGGTCFCVSMDTGPRARAGFDLAITELMDGASHAFLVEVGSDLGAQVLAEITHRPATAEDHRAAREALAQAAGRMGRRLDTRDIKPLLQSNPEHPRWNEVASRCLACANCTMVCPTCFCTSVEDTSDLSGERAERWRRWDSCFTLDHSYIHGGSVRQSAKSRYRQWMTHKLAHWIDQFGRSGCVGCGRCITWCPVGIDITEEVAAISSTSRLEGQPT